MVKLIRGPALASVHAFSLVQRVDLALLIEIFKGEPSFPSSLSVVPFLGMSVGRIFCVKLSL
eukprot:c7763_g1_i2 orf=177-362(+)